MKRFGIINAPLAGRLARLGHTDLVVVADAGLPVPAHVPVVDLAVVYGVPRFTDVLGPLLAELVVEAAWMATEADRSPAGAWIDDALAFPAERVEHADLKAMAHEARVVVRTGEATPYANVVLRCGVPFG
jgi:D-ribose pyranase